METTTTSDGGCRLKEYLKKALIVALVAVSATLFLLHVKPHDDVMTTRASHYDEKTTTTFVYHMHVPKTGGRTVMQQLYAWGLCGRHYNCIVNQCCLPTMNHYLKQVRRAFNMTIAKSSNKASKCTSISYETYYPTIQRTRQLWLQLKAEYNETRGMAKSELLQHERWYAVSLFANPVARFVSGSKHMMRHHACGPQDNLTLAVETRMNHQCKRHGYDNGQAFYYFSSDYQVATLRAMQLNNDTDKQAVDNLIKEHEEEQLNLGNQTTAMLPQMRIKYQQLSSTLLQHPYQQLESNFDFIGITHYMDETMCLLLHDLVRLGLVDLKSLTDFQNVCNAKGTHFFIQSTREGEAASAPLDTSTLLTIMSDWCYVDTQVYAHVLNAFVERLERVITTNNNKTLPPSPRNADMVLSKAREEQVVWEKVSQYMHEFKTGVSTEKKTLSRLNALSQNEKDLVVPQQYGGWTS